MGTPIPDSAGGRLYTPVAAGCQSLRGSSGSLHKSLALWQIGWASMKKYRGESEIGKCFNQTCSRASAF
jgi:hypothetical protein